MNRNIRTDTIRVATFIAEKFSIYTTNPARLRDFARDAIASGQTFSLNLTESLERVSKW